MMDNQLIIDMNGGQCDLNYVQFDNINSFDRICRTCLTERGELRSLFNERIIEMLMSFTSVQFEINDGLPPHICTQCILNVSRAFNFKQQVEASDVTLRQYISNYNNPTETLPNILEMGYDIANLPITVTPEQADEIISNDSKSNFFMINDDTEDQITTKEYINSKLIKDEVLNLPIPDTKQELLVKDTLNNTMNGVKNEMSITIENEKIMNDVGDLKCLNNFTKEIIVQRGDSLDDMICDVCNLICKGPEEFKKHKKSHEKNKAHKCGECGKSFQYKVGLRTHMRTHGVGEKKHLCTQCGKRFYEPNELLIHTRNHTGERPIVCDTCGKSFADPRSLAKHIKIHKGEKKFECEICHKRFIHSYTLTAHRRVHTGEKPFVCSTCGHACATSTQLTLHTRTHTHEKPYGCTLCSKSFASRSGLSTHQMTHTGERKYICSICGKGARTSTDLASHSRTHTGEKPYECKIPQCTKKYRTHSQLSAHMRTHTGEKRHKCTFCGKAFADTSQLKSHKNIHTGEKPYCCATCGQRFTQSGSLYTHMKTHHKQ